MYIIIKIIVTISYPSVFQVAPACVSDIKFVQPSNKKICLDPGISVPAPTSQNKKSIIKPPTAEELDGFFSKISKAEKKPAILKIVKPYAEQFIPRLNHTSLPSPMMDLYNPELLHVDYLSLLNECEARFECLKVSKLIIIKMCMFKSFFHYPGN